MIADMLGAWPTMRILTCLSTTSALKRPAGSTAARFGVVSPAAMPAWVVAAKPAGGCGSGVALTSAAYWAGLTDTTLNWRPNGVVAIVRSASATCWTPGAAMTARVSAGLTGPGLVMTASAPACCQDELTSPVSTAPRTMPANETKASASTSAKAGSAALPDDRAALASPRNAAALARCPVSRSTPRTITGYRRTTTTATPIASSTGAAVG